MEMKYFPYSKHLYALLSENIENIFRGNNLHNQSAEGAGGLGIIRSNKVGETE